MNPTERTAMSAFRLRWGDFTTRLSGMMERVRGIDPPLTDQQRWEVERAAEEVFAPDLERETKRLRGAQGKN